MKEISERLASPSGRSLSLEEFMVDDQDRVENEFFNLCEEDPAVSAVMKQYGATRDFERAVQ